ncbi:GNAT family N-acetyltransferase [Croceicoccus bisphenolivorans]|uniref:GNAT family N-acetyltransferase n=1 Tax=Croceicoccus bisphenolivorans TaxID=1783232 RepID=UPI00082DACFD|nr:GNAT family N-acetyltransferase [Croceicoccus bisphenolivorans]
MTTQSLAPVTHDLSGTTVTLRPIAPDDADAILVFANSLPVHDLLFLQRDIRNPRVVAAWLDEIAAGTIRSMLAIDGDTVLGCTALVRDDLSWSSHVAEIRILVDPASRGMGLGRLLAMHCLDAAAVDGIDKILVRMTPDQDGARRMFEEMGFVPEALLRDHVRDAEGTTSDILVMALDTQRHAARQATYGLSG